MAEILISFDKGDRSKYIPLFSKEEIDDKYRLGEKRLVTEQGRYPLDSLDTILNKSIQLDPEYQRSFVWNDNQKSKLIESFIMNVPIPPVFLYEIEFAKYEVMDGRQRLTTIRDFYADRFQLNGLEIWPELNGMKYSQLPENVKLGIDRRYISTIVILNETAKTEEEAFELKQHVFERLNTGGTKLSDQEIRNAIMRGPMNDFCKKIAVESNIFHEIWDIKVLENYFLDESEEIEDKYIRMEDVELVLRFFAYRQLEENPKGTVKDILDLYLQEANEQVTRQEQFCEMNILFEKTLQLQLEIFGDKLFKLYTYKKSVKEYTWNNKVTKLLYDPINIIFSQYIQDEKIVSILSKESFEENLEILFKENQDIFNGRNNSKVNVRERVRLFETFFSNNLQVNSNG